MYTNIHKYPILKTDKFFYEYVYIFDMMEYVKYQTHYRHFVDEWVSKFCNFLERQENKATNRGKENVNALYKSTSYLE